MADPGSSRPPWSVLAAISVGGVLGALARAGVNQRFMPAPGRFPWPILGVNVSGCLLIGVLMVLISQVWVGRRLLRPFLGVGVLGGYTTFSGYLLDVERTRAAGAADTALAVLVLTPVLAVAATWLGSRATAGALNARRSLATRRKAR